MDITEVKQWPLMCVADKQSAGSSRCVARTLTSHVEGLPNVLVEAMSCGCTPVATDCPTGPREVLHNGRNGYLVTPGNPSSIAEGILRALDCPVPAEDLARAVIPFQEDAVISRHFEILGLLERDSTKASQNESRS